MWLVLALLGLGGSAVYLSREAEQHSTRTAPPPAGVGAVPPTPQETPYTCGAAALRGVLAHYGQRISEDDASIIVGTDPIYGTNAARLVVGAQALGFTALARSLRGVAALAPFLARGVPVLCVVDSFTHPGEQKHWIVVTALGRYGVKIMDPNVDGNRRVLTAAEFDRRWAPARGAVIVVPAASSASTPAAMGAAPLASHGRTAKCEAGGGFPGFMQSLFRGAAKAMLDVVTAGRGGKLAQPVLDEMTARTRGLDAQAFAAWINQASNDEVVLYGMARAKAHVEKHASEPTWRSYYADRIGVSPDDYQSTVAQAVEATLRHGLGLHGAPVSAPPCIVLHVLQAVALAAYGGPPALAVLTAQLAKPHRRKGVSGEQFRAWVDETVGLLERVRDAGGAAVGAAGGCTRDEDLAKAALRRLGNFLTNARIPADARVFETTDGMHLGVIDHGLAPQDLAALPKSVSGLKVEVVREGAGA